MDLIGARPGGRVRQGAAGVTKSTSRGSWRQVGKTSLRPLKWYVERSDQAPRWEGGLLTQAQGHARRPGRS